jgi:hypothetical protein
MDGRVRNRFLARCEEFLRLRTEQPDRPPPLPFDSDGPLDIREADKPAMEFSERYAILAALHGVICHQEPSIRPASARQYSDQNSRPPRQPARLFGPV